MKSIFSFLLLCSLVASAQHTISGTFLPAENFSNIFLYKSSPSGSTYIERSAVQPDGSFSFTLDDKTKAGIYKLVYNLPVEENNFDLIYDGNENIKLSFETGKELVFEESQENMLWTSYLKSINIPMNALSSFYSEEKLEATSYAEIAHNLKTIQQDFEEKAEGLLVLEFIKANKPYIPSEMEALGTYFNHVRETFFRSIDFSNPLLQSSDYLTNKVLTFVFDLVSNPNNEFYQEQIDRLATSIGNDNKTVQKNYLFLLWQQFVDMKNDEVANYISSRYLEKLANDTKDKMLLETIVAHKNTTLGSVAQNFDIPLTENGQEITTTLHDLKGAKQYLLIFWSSTCGHCLNELPKLRDFLKDVPKETLTVVAFGMEDEDSPWKAVIKKFPEFIHVLGLGKWNNPISDLYGVQATPSYFLLDKDKKIIAKPEDVEALLNLLKSTP